MQMVTQRFFKWGGFNYNLIYSYFIVCQSIVNDSLHLFLIMYGLEGA